MKPTYKMEEWTIAISSVYCPPEARTAIGYGPCPVRACEVSPLSLAAVLRSGGMVETGPICKVLDGRRFQTKSGSVYELVGPAHRQAAGYYRKMGLSEEQVSRVVWSEEPLYVLRSLGLVPYNDGKFREEGAAEASGLTLPEWS